MLVSGTAGLLDLLCQKASFAISLDAQPARYHQGVLGQWGIQHAQIPKRSNAELLERTSVERHEIGIWLAAHISCCSMDNRIGTGHVFSGISEMPGCGRTLRWSRRCVRGSLPIASRIADTR